MKLEEATRILNNQIDGKYRVCCDEYHHHNSNCLIYDSPIIEAIHRALREVRNQKKLRSLFNESSLNQTEI